MEERDGFVAGYLDCYIWDANGTNYPRQPIEQITTELTLFYRQHPNSRSRLVPEALQLFSKPHERPINGERHGVYDGDYWRQSNRRHRSAFLRGYIACVNSRPQTRYSRPIETYLSEISKWYGVSEQDESRLDEKTANDKIGDVLSLLRDGIKSSAAHQGK